MPPDRDFVLDRLPGQDGACLAIGAGHAYKFASVIGRILAELAIDDTTPSDIGAFRFDRPVMKLINPSVDFRRVSDFHRH
jgi:sarcosine oxidase